MTIKTIADLTPDPRNARAHTPRNVGMIETALNEVGAARSIVIDEDGVVLAGNATIEAAAQAGIERVQVVDADGNTIIAVRRSGLTPEQKTRLALFDNRAAELADWDAGVLAALAEEIDLSGLFRDEELAALLAQEAVDIGGAGDEFDTTPQDGPTRTQAGDLWIIGEKHRLLVGDCTDAANVERLMGGERAALMLSDPPYNVGYDYDSTDDEMSPEDYAQFCRTYLYLGSLHSDMQVITPGKSNERLYDPEETMTWYKGFGLSRGHYYKAMVTEPILLFGEKPKGKFYATDHFDFHTERIEGLREMHTCPKPIALFTALLEPMTERGDVVYDAFLGSGTTLIAAHQTGRRCYGMEISPRYADVILRRAEAAGLSCERHE